MDDVVSGSAVRAAHELRAVLSRLRRLLREVAAGDDLTPSQTAVLGRLGKDGAASASALAAAEGVRPQSMATTLGALDQRGLLRRDPDPDDGRRQLLTLSVLGRERFEGRQQAKQEWLARAFEERYTEAERRLVLEAMTLLDRLT